MNMKTMTPAILLTALASLSGAASAASFDLCAGSTTKTLPDGSSVAMWGYGLDTGGACAPTVPGPRLTVPVGDNTLTINLRNELSEPVSVVISGQQATMSPVLFTDGQGRSRVRSFTHETAPTATASYSWNNIKPGTYLYMSGTHPAVQVQMGLYGGLTRDAALGEAYPGVAYDNEVLLLYSEIDPALHNAVATNDYGPGKGMSSTVNYAPRYFLVNGTPFQDTDLPVSAGAVGDRTLLRLLNAGLEDHSLVLQGMHMSVVAEDGNLYPWAREQYALLMAAGKTRDAVISAQSAGVYPVYDRRLRQGMLTRLAVADALPGPTAVADAAVVDEDSVANLIAVLANDTQAPSTSPIDPASVQIAQQALNGLAVANADGSIAYTPNPDFAGPDSFAYRVRDTAGQLSNLAAVSVSVSPLNDQPVALDDAFSVAQDSGTTLLDVLANDSDIDGDTLSISVVGPADNGGVLSTDGARVSYSPAAGFAGVESFGYFISDANGGTASATVSVTVTAAPGNLAPVASDDYATVTRNVGASTNSVTVNVLANDSDADGTLDAATVSITSGARKGTVLVNPDGSVTYTPTAGKRGSDAFGYTVNDNLGASSNEAVVRIDILK